MTNSVMVTTTADFGKRMEEEDTKTEASPEVMDVDTTDDQAVAE